MIVEVVGLTGVAGVTVEPVLGAAGLDGAGGSVRTVVSSMRLQRRLAGSCGS